MINLHHGREGRPFVVNADHIETVEATPDTVVTLTSGRKLIVLETPEEVIALCAEFKRLADKPRLLTER